MSSPEARRAVASSASPGRRRSTALYRAIIAQVRARIEELSLPFWVVDDLAGVQDGYTAKLLHPDTPSGRQAGWAQLQLLLDALYPAGLSIVVVPHVENVRPLPQPHPKPAWKKPSRQPLPPVRPLMVRAT